MSYPPHTILDDLIARYDVFLVDQFGVLRDDAGAYPGAAEALVALKKAGKTVVILSNSGRSGDYNAERFVKLGFPSDSFDRFVTSGDAAYAVLSRPDAQLPARAKCLTISSGGDRNLADRLGMESVTSAEDADLIIISGSEAETVPMETYREMLRPAAIRRLPCICTNPDIHKLANGATAPGAGAIAKLYETLGGSVRWFGKPHRAIYDFALKLCENPPPARVVCIGDSIEHDIRGAKDAGLDSVLVETGILAEYGGPDRVELMDEFGASPTFVMTSFVV
ncbi:TIGR01459 family HAD-type hydrolase [Oryzicola mucosus]|uniref:TIGR01459 family HAD-type hydrolase n=1 Tax=Oryzicola mucosus TaxID=2767425 RepID=A0A8J6PP24_9HYPH|nr:TIGR01459 family HAD-type hydrolase [Oryzicola mucosus]MBD0415095.1 TIGR01459 family HAD-type hydrolase [Oryzicola mucosus]